MEEKSKTIINNIENRYKRDQIFKVTKIMRLLTRYIAT